MVRPNTLQRLEAMYQVRKAVTQANRIELATRSRAYDDAKAKEGVAIGARDEGLSIWRDGLARKAFDPAFVGVTGAWLLDLESRLSVAKLDTSIAAVQQDEAMAGLAHATASETAADGMCEATRRKIRKKREERQSIDQSDMVLWRWSQ